MGKQKQEDEKLDSATMEKIRSLVESIQWGTVTIVIHDNRIVQLETSNRIRLF